MLYVTLFYGRTYSGFLVNWYCVEMGSFRVFLSCHFVVYIHCEVLYFFARKQNGLGFLPSGHGKRKPVVWRLASPGESARYSVIPYHYSVAVSPRSMPHTVRKERSQ